MTNLVRRFRGRDLPLWVPAAYPIVIAVAYVGVLFLGIDVSIFSAARTFLVTALGAAVIGIVANVLMQDRHRGGLLALSVVLLVMFGTRLRVIAVLGVVIALLIAERVASGRLGSRLGTRIPWPRVSLVANAVAGIFLLTFVITGVEGGGFRRVIAELNPVRSQVPAATDVTDRPDIYVILLDGYARPDKMKDLFGFDDGAFIGGLQDRGFDVASDSRSNYLLTTLSIPSLLNMRHINDLIEATPGSHPPGYRTLVRALVSDGEVVRRMRGLGYRITAISAGFEEVIMYGADELIDTGQVNEFEFVMMRQTAIAPLLNLAVPDFFAGQQRARTVGVLEATAGVARSRHAQPSFVFVHVPSPHGPIVFGPAGEHVRAPALSRFYEDTASGLRISRETFGRRYVGQVQYLNGRVLETVDAILAASAKPPVILVLSDHGSGSGLIWNDLAHSDLDERSANLFAAYTPGHEDVFPDDITLVNAFGHLLGGYFGIAIPEQPDVLYRWDDTNSHLIITPATKGAG